MTDPSKRRASDAACRLVAEVFTEWANIAEPPECPARVRCWLEKVQPALTAYRREIAPLRSKAEVDAERLLNLDAWKAGAIDGRMLRERDTTLVNEETAPDPTELGACTPDCAPCSRLPDTLVQQTLAADEPEACSCEEAEALKAQLDRCRAIVRSWVLDTVDCKSARVALERELVRGIER